MTEVIILRGIPGSGKTTWAKEYQNGDASISIASSDNYMVDPYTGKYSFDRALLPETHAACLRQFVNALRPPRLEYKAVIVDNTNLDVTDIAPYYALGLAYASFVYIKEFPIDVRVACRRQVHDVSLATMRAMDVAYWAQRHRYMPWWVVR